MISKCQVFSSTVPKKPKISTELARPSRLLNIYAVAKYQKNEAGPFEDIENDYDTLAATNYHDLASSINSQ